MNKLTKFSSLEQTSQPWPSYVVSITINPTSIGREEKYRAKQDLDENFNDKEASEDHNYHPS